jgi:hypothetical protein
MTLAGCNLLNDRNGFRAAFHGTADDLFGGLAHGGSICTPSAKSKGSITSMSRTISHRRQREKKNIRQNRLQHSRRAFHGKGHAYSLRSFSFMRHDSADP